MNSKKIIILGGAGLVGQNLVAHLKSNDYKNIVVLDKHRFNLELLSKVQPDIITEYADLAEPGPWERHFEGAAIVVMLQAQIGGKNYEDFLRNNVISTKVSIEAIKNYKVPYLIHVSSSVVESVVDDFYTKTKEEQENLVLASGVPCLVLRPTLMFGWFDRKHLGWLSRFMRKTPIFPIPGYRACMRQPLYVGDFCNIIIQCIEKQNKGIYNISGHEKVDYIDIIREIKRATRARTLIIRFPYTLFYALLWLWGKFDKNPPFTTQQLLALKTKESFEVIDWPSIFGISRTSFKNAINETFNSLQYSHIELKF